MSGAVSRIQQEESKGSEAKETRMKAFDYCIGILIIAALAILIYRLISV